MGNSLVAQPGKNVDVPPYGNPPNPRSIPERKPHLLLDSPLFPELDTRPRKGCIRRDARAYKERRSFTFESLLLSGEDKVALSSGSFGRNTRGKTEEVKFPPFEVVAPVSVRPERGRWD